MIAKPSRAQLLSMRPGRDGAVVFPPRSKPDQWGETHCPFPVRLTYETTELNPAAALRDLELNIGAQVTDRDSHPPFGDAAERAYTRRPTPRLTRVPVRSRPQSLQRLQHRHRFGNLCARSPAPYLRRAPGPPPAAANDGTTR